MHQIELYVQTDLIGVRALPEVGGSVGWIGGSVDRSCWCRVDRWIGLVGAEWIGGSVLLVPSGSVDWSCWFGRGWVDGLNGWVDGLKWMGGLVKMDGWIGGMCIVVLCNAFASINMIKG